MYYTFKLNFGVTGGNSVTWCNYCGKSLGSIY